jgi:hypothetical protein
MVSRITKKTIQIINTFFILFSLLYIILRNLRFLYFDVIFKNLFTYAEDYTCVR